MSFELRYGTWLRPPPDSPSALMTSPSAERLLLMFFASASRCPVAPVCARARGERRWRGAMSRGRTAARATRSVHSRLREAFGAGEVDKVELTDAIAFVSGRAARDLHREHEMRAARVLVDVV